MVFYCLEKNQGAAPLLLRHPGLLEIALTHMDVANAGVLAYMDVGHGVTQGAFTGLALAPSMAIVGRDPLFSIFPFD